MLIEFGLSTRPGLPSGIMSCFVRTKANNQVIKMPKTEFALFQNINFRKIFFGKSKDQALFKKWQKYKSHLTNKGTCQKDDNVQFSLFCLESLELELECRP